MTDEMDRNKKIKPIIKKGWATSHYMCPSCEYEVFLNLGYGKTGCEYKFCPNCGQAFSWGSVTDEEIITKYSLLKYGQGD